MSPRPRPGAVPAGRVRELLARPPGWVPPPEPGDAVPGPYPVADREEGIGLSPAPGAAASWSTATPPDEADAGPLALPSSGPPPCSPPEDARGRLGGVLPEALRTGRLDPGRRAAAALVLVAVLAAAVAGAVVLRGRPQEVLVPRVLASGTPLTGASPAPGGGPTPGAAVAPEPGTEVVVSVGGKVVRPGLVRLPAGSRVDDAVRAAGGPVAGVSTGLLNLARRLVDGEQVLVGVDPPPGAPAAPGGTGQPGGPLDLNAASASDLDALPGIGPVLAQRIVDWRTEHGRFASVDQLREVTGIGEAKYEDLRGEVTV